MRRPFPSIDYSVRKQLLAFSLLLFLPIQDLLAENSHLHHCLNNYLRGPLLTFFTQQLENKLLKIKDQESSTQKFKIQLGKKRGQGIKAGVYELQENLNTLTKIPFIENIYALDPTHQYVIKIPHALRGSKGKIQLDFPKIKFELNQLAREVDIFRYIKSETFQEKYRERLQSMDIKFSFKNIPVAPIEFILKTQRGELLIRPLIKGRDLKAIKKTQGVKLSPQQESSLKEIFALNLFLGENFTYYDHTKKRVYPFYIDINPTNFVWIENPEEMKLLGLARPGFYLYELTVHKSNRRKTRDNYTPESFIQEFKKALKSS